MTVARFDELRAKANRGVVVTERQTVAEYMETWLKGRARELNSPNERRQRDRVHPEDAQERLGSSVPARTFVPTHTCRASYPQALTGTLSAASPPVKLIFISCEHAHSARVDRPRPMLAFRDRAKIEDHSKLIADAIRAGVDINSIPTPTKQDRQSLRALELRHRRSATSPGADYTSDVRSHIVLVRNLPT